MTDIVERLRAYAQTRRPGGMGQFRLALEAADEIERLREALESISKCDGAYDPEPMQHALNCMTNMRDVARAALSQKEGE